MSFIGLIPRMSASTPRSRSARSPSAGVLIGAQLFGRASETLFRTICYALIATAVVIGLPARDGVLR